MSAVQTLGMMLSDPQRGQVALHALHPLISLKPSVDGIGRASCVDDSVLLKRHPSKPESNALWQIITDLRARCTLLHIRDETDLRPKHRSPKNLGPFRSRAYAFTSSGGPDSSDEANALREKHLAALPDFLRRNVEGQSESEAFFFVLLSRLHDAGELRLKRPDPKVVLELMQELVEQSGGHPRHLLFASPSHCVHLAHRSPILRVTMNGLQEELAEIVDPTLTDSSMGRERLRRFRATVTIGYGDVLPAFEEMSGVEFEAHAEGAATFTSAQLEHGAL